MVKSILSIMMSVLKFGNNCKIEKIYRFSKLNFSCGVFPKKVAFVKGEIRGYTMDYIDGVYPED